MIARKVITFRAVSFVATLLAGRVWFGDWHTSWFGLFLIPYCTAIHWIFEKIWTKITGEV